MGKGEVATWGNPWVSKFLSEPLETGWRGCWNSSQPTTEWGLMDNVLSGSCYWTSHSASPWNWLLWDTGSLWSHGHCESCLLCTGSLWSHGHCESYLLCTGSLWSRGHWVVSPVHWVTVISWTLWGMSLGHWVTVISWTLSRVSCTWDCCDLVGTVSRVEQRGLCHYFDFQRAQSKFGSFYNILAAKLNLSSNFSTLMFPLD